MSSRPCACQGSNENCRYCFGSGFLRGSQSSRTSNLDPSQLVRVQANTSHTDKLKGHWAGMILDDTRRSAEIPEARYLEFFEKRRLAQQKPKVLLPTAVRSVVARPRLSQAPPKRSAPPKSLSTKKISGQCLAMCEYCNVALNPSHIESHNYKVHGIGKWPARPNKPTRQDIPNNERAHSQDTRPTFAFCRICHWRLRSEDIQSHVEKVHSPARPSFLSWEQHSRMSARHAGTTLTRMLVPCPKCPSSVRTDHLQSHLTRIHGSDAAALPSGVSATINSAPTAPSGRERRPNLTKKVGSGVNARYRALSTGSGHSGPSHDDGDDRAASVDNYWEERRLDGSRDYSQIREDGRFGSHPSYDACDDESAP
jgi:hypothetical protein